MSADNWAVCPRCKAKMQAKAQAAHQAALDAYGTVPPQEYQRLYSEAEQMMAAALLDTNEHHTFREDYEIYGADEGEVQVTYSGACSKCGLSLKFEHSHRLEI